MSETSAKRVWITGVGTIGSAGDSVEAIAECVAQPGAPQVEVDRSEGFHREGSAHEALLLGKVSTMPYISPIVSRRMSPPSRLGIICLATKVSSLTPFLSLRLAQYF